MKKVALLALAAMAFFSCSKDEMPTTPGSNEEPLVILKINVQGAIGSRSIEGEHGGIDGTEVLPKIFNGVIIPYNDHGVAMSPIQLTDADIKNALTKKYVDKDGIPQDGGNIGATIGLPRGTQKVDIILNQFTAAEKGITNINYFNMREYKDIDTGLPITNNGTKDNFDRVPLVTEYQGVGVALGKNTASQGEKPAYSIDFDVKPYFARFEVFGAINVKAADIWKDKWGNTWHTMARIVFDGINDPKGKDKIEFELDGQGSDYGIMAGTTTNGFDINTVYIPQYYWHKAKPEGDGPSDNLIKDGDPDNNVYKRETIDNSPTINVGWVKQDFESLDLTTLPAVTWYPNAFYAVDVEEIFINNIKIRNYDFPASMHAWPGSNSPTWENWYNAFHLYGWHKAGVSADNTFLCRANMWDRIADSDGKKPIDIPAIAMGTESHDKMDVLTGKAKPVSEVSEFAATGHNLGVTPGKAAAYQIYAQSSNLENNDANKNALANALPHVILKVKAYKTKGDYDAPKKTAGKEFITVKLFTNGSNRICDFKAGSIYRFNLNDLLSSFVGEIPVPGGKVNDNNKPTDPIEPDPEMPGSSLTAKVTVVPWKIVNMTPEI